MDNDFATGYAIGQSDSNNGGGGGNSMWGDGSWIFALIIIAVLILSHKGTSAHRTEAGHGRDSFGAIKKSRPFGRLG